MTNLIILRTVVFSLLLLLLATRIRSEDESDQAVPIAAEDLKAWGNQPIVFTARLESVIAGPVARSLPPVRSHTLKFKVEEMIRGDAGADEISCSHTVRQEAVPTFPVGKRVIVAIAKTRGEMRVERIVEVTDEVLTRVRTATLFPMGWTIVDGKPVSPWASLGDDAWPAQQKGTSSLTCSQTGRPMLLAGKDVKFEVEKVDPHVDIKWTNPDGDGEYRITVSNATDAPIRIPALLTNGKEILWKESLVVRCQEKSYAVPGAQGVREAVTAVELKPGESVSTVVNSLALNGPEWPRGGYRIEFQFCLGEKSSVLSFYYLSRHHDKVREELKAKEKR